MVPDRRGGHLSGISLLLTIPGSDGAIGGGDPGSATGDLAVVIDATSINATVATGTNIQIVYIMASTTGGTPPYTWSWTTTDSRVQAATPTAEDTFIRSSSSVNATITGTLTLTVTDSLSATSSDTLPFTVTHVSGGTAPGGGGGGGGDGVIRPN